MVESSLSAHAERTCYWQGNDESKLGAAGDFSAIHFLFYNTLNLMLFISYQRCVFSHQIIRTFAGETSSKVTL